MFKSTSLLLAGIASLFVANAATAADTANAMAPQTYMGLNLAVQSKYDLSCASTSPCDRKANSSGKIFGGYMMAPSLFEGVNVSQGVELMYYKVGNAKALFDSSNGMQAGTGNTKGVAASYVLQANFNDFSINGRAGVSYAQSKVNYLSGGSSSDKSFFVPVVGLGMRYAITPNVTLNADYDRLPDRFNDKEKGSVNMFSLGVGYKF
ncbi:MAG: porin family protein [Burkholderiales bacterium]|nr:porin family protein [Burkholderiales bacterium]